ncbi:hypothetical protein FHS95_002258 [Sphingomonas naasensis]|uniref:Uncharacterized protein n=1 Tax=Sphingomonas naasensis TaxID=1344951 RepID=A0A4S1WMY5_9SPHN|nr:DUF6683 family protein [Sphingomonas naasensis]NIJ20566.1 hypothetical protein [Sphingomonas naasensis]TGX44649.1 hypothetical protein E5A74_07755 [Sphingomonas naasensis]
MRVAAAILSLLVGLAAPAAAQEMGTVLPHNYVLSDILNRQRVEAAIGAPLDRPARQPAERAVPAAPGAAAATSYRPSPAVSARVRRHFASWMGGKVGAADAAKLAAVMEKTDPVRNWAQLVANDGLRTNDMADALTAYWILNWAMANTADNNRAQVLGVRAQVRAMLVANPAQLRMGEAQRQEFSEILILNFLIQHAAFDDAIRRGDRVLMQRLGDAAVARFQSEMGVDLRRLRLTDTGFAPAG